jgi:hypothetical protein
VSGSTNPARAQLERLLTPETLAELDLRVLALVTGQAPEPEPEPMGLLEAAAAAKAERKRAVLDAVLGRAPAPARASPGLDGGARTTPERPKTHDQ